MLDNKIWGNCVTKIAKLFHVQEDVTFPPGSVLYFKGVGEQTSREDLKVLKITI